MAKIAKKVYISPYTSEMISDYLVQYSNDKDEQLELRSRIIAKRPNGERPNMRLTPYFKTRCKNLVSKLYETKDGAVFVETLVKAVGVTMSGYFPYRDVIDIVKQKQNELVFDTDDSLILGYIVKSLELNHVIAPKIAAIYKITHGEFDVEN